MKKVGLVLEGGGMRGVYTGGVLDFFLDKNLHIPYIVGVSAGACNAVSYVSKQRGRNAKATIGYANDWRYLSLRNMLRERSLFGMHFIFDEIPNKLVPFDYKTFAEAPSNLQVGVTNCKTGKTMYFPKQDLVQNFDLLKASASLPIVSPIYRYKHYELLDGGITEPIPIYKSIEDGNEKHIIVLTRNKEYRKPPSGFTKLLKHSFKRYPELLKAMEIRHQHYNDTLDLIETMETAGQAVVIRPNQPLEVDRFERNQAKLHKLYEQGYADAENRYEEIQQVLS